MTPFSSTSPSISEEETILRGMGCNRLLGGWERVLNASKSIDVSHTAGVPTSGDGNLSGETRSKW